MRPPFLLRRDLGLVRARGRGSELSIVLPLGRVAAGFPAAGAT